MSLEVERRLAEKLEPPYVDPYGNPIPGLAALGITETQDTLDGKDPVNPPRELLESVADGETIEVTLRQIGERVQSDVELLGELARHGVIPGAQIHAERLAATVVLRGPSGGEVAVSEIVAGQLRVTPIQAG